ncbi:choline transporter-like protein 1 isoform X1 [Procambarus clarkii]|uniref:choline transporter-like protein 1 isoform X1 n=2 Tax=Procambarus clarkii TaxID=6728 RepID=UPI0037440F9E
MERAARTRKKTTGDGGAGVGAPHQAAGVSMGCCGLATRVATAKVNGKELAPPVTDDFDGPLKNRVCRDVIFLILFIAFVVGTIAFLGYVGTKSDPQRIIHGYDKHGNVCGKKNKPYFNISSSGQDFTAQPFLQLGFGIPTADDYVTGDVTTRSCAASCPNSSTVIGYMCLPINFSDTANKTNAITQILFGVSLNNFFQRAGRDLHATWREMLIMCAVAFAIAVVITILLRFLAQVVVWLSVIIMIVGSIGGTAYLWVLWHKNTNNLKNMQNNSSSSNAYEIKVTQNYIQSLLIGAIVSTIVTVLFLIILIAMRNRIKLVIALFKEAGKAVASMPLMLLQPIWTFLWLALVCALWVLGWIIIESSGDPNKYYNTIVFVINDFIKYMRIYHIFAILWITQFLLACQDVTIAGAVAQWYFTRNKKELGWPIAESMHRMFRYHLGSIALGSLIIAIVKFIRLILKYIERKLNGNSNQVCSFMLKCCQCCLWCFEKFLKFLSRNAYIEIAIYGYGFCKAAQQAFVLLAANALRVVAINSVGTFVLFLAKASVVICTVLIGFQILKTKPELSYVWVPLLLIAIFSFFIAHCFISVYEMTIDTLFLCFCEDCEKNDGIQRPYYMSKGLMKFVENSKQAMDILENPQQKQEQPWTTNVQPSSGQMYPAQYLSPSHAAGGIAPLYPAYPPLSAPPSPSNFFARGTS